MCPGPARLGMGCWRDRVVARLFWQSAADLRGSDGRRRTARARFGLRVRVRCLAHKRVRRTGRPVDHALAGPGGMSDPYHPPKARVVQPKIVAARLWQRNRQDGGFYLAGNMGAGLKVLVTQNREQTDPLDAGWVLIFQEDAPANKRPRNKEKE